MRLEAEFPLDFCQASMSAALIAVQTQIQTASQNPESQSECTNFSSLEKSVFEAWREMCTTYFPREFYNSSFRNWLTSIDLVALHVNTMPMVAAYQNGWLSDDESVDGESVDGESDAETSNYHGFFLG